MIVGSDEEASDGFIFDMLRSSGWLFGASMLFAGLVALVLCARATFVRTGRARRAAVIASVSPVLIGFLGVAVGAVLLLLASRRGVEVTNDWPHLGYIVLFGVTVAAVPLLWSALLRVGRGRAAAS